MDLVSIIIPYYKKKEFFLKTIKSVINQNYKKIEIIVIFDDDKIEELKFIKKIISKYKNVVLINNKKNHGVSYSRNIGINKAKGEYIAFIDSDDLWLPSKISLQISFMKKFKYDFSYTNFNIIDEHDLITGKMKCPKELNQHRLKYSCDIGLSTVMGKRSLFRKYKFPIIKTKEDYALWLRLVKSNVLLKGLNKTLTSWRNVKKSLSKSFIQKIKDAFKIYYVFEKRGLFFSIFSIFMMCFLFIKKRLFQFYQINI